MGVTQPALSNVSIRLGISTSTMGALRCCCSLALLLSIAATLLPRVAMEEDVLVELEEGDFESDVHVAKLEFERVETVLVVSLFIMAVVLAKLGEARANGFHACAVQVQRTSLCSDCTETHCSVDCLVNIS